MEDGGGLLRHPPPPIPDCGATVASMRIHEQTQPVRKCQRPLPCVFVHADI